ncbi:MAG: TIGR02680 family protein [Streptomycetaceae bacterium]|nr:TIGR02680 family protein [Streptomycetaceae bacterium]
MSEAQQRAESRTAQAAGADDRRATRAETEAAGKLPHPLTERWQPLRVGLVDLFHYDAQEFWFRDGRLLWRGNNGTGKSKVLALTLPFLFDGEISPHRVEPDGDPHKRMEWNLLLGGKYEERLGYTWIEFGRLDGNGTARFLTAGIALKAAAGRGIADRWFFTTDRRIGEELFLLSRGGNALTRDRLTEAIGERGHVVRTAEQYRRLLDEHLFHLGVDRYAALVDLLIQLRQPQLSKRPDEKVLSKALSDALAPLDHGLLADVAAGFHDLEQQRAELASLRDSRTHVGRFLDRYVRYAATAARRQARELRGAQSSYEEMGRRLGAVRQELEASRAEHDAAQARLGEIEAEQHELQTVREQLTERPELRDLDRAERETEAAGRRQRQAAERAEAAEAEHDRRAARLDEARRQAESGRQALDAALTAAEGSAADAGITAAHERAAAPLRPLTEPADLADPAAVDTADNEDVTLSGARRALATAADDRESAVGQLQELIGQAAHAAAEEAAARRRLAEREADRDVAADAVADAELTVAAEGERLVERWRQYAADTDAFTVPQPDETGLAEWTATLDGPDPALAAAREVAAAAQSALAAQQADARTALTAAREAVRGLEEEQTALRAGVVRGPAPAHTRAEGIRDGRPGTPLWRAVDFAEHIPADQRAALEAALEAAGLLDAWLTPDGALLTPGTHDTVALPGAPAPRSLAEVLRPALDHDDEQAARLDDQAVTAVLTAVELADTAPADGHPACVGLDGSFRLGTLHGHWAKPAAEYLGAGAREEARRRRLAELDTELDQARQAVTTAEAAAQQAGQALRELTRQANAHPSDQPLRDAHAASAAARADLARRATEVDRARPIVERAVQAALAAARIRDESAADLGLPTHEARLAAVRAALGRYRTACADLLAATRRHIDLLRTAASWATEAAAARIALEETAQARQEADTEHREARARLNTLRESVGDTVEELKKKLAETRAALERLSGERKATTSALSDAIRRTGQAEGREQQIKDDQAEQQHRRDGAVAAFRRFTATGLLTVALPKLDVPDPEEEWATDPAVRLARRAEAELTDTDDSDTAWRRVQDDITRRFSELAEALTRHGHQAHAELREDRYVVTVVYTGRDRTPGELAALLAEEIDRREVELTAREQQVLEEHLVGDVAGRLQELIAEAETQVGWMNDELAERPTSTGMRLRLRWDPDPQGPEGLAQARARLLRQNAELWSAADRKAVSDFLQRQIERERTDDPQGTWSDHLSRALDYRAWHCFAIERYQDGRWRSATGPASGGERVLTVSLPLFAAASAHYRSAHPHAPRLVLLDEAFAGVDDDARAKCLGLLAQFDLDVAMTSEREWGFYATVPGIATHQLVRRDGIDAVHVSVWEWDGAVPRQITRPPARLTPPAPGTPPTPAPEAQLDEILF